MDTALLLEKLIEIGKAVGLKDPPTVRKMVADAQDMVLLMEKQAVESDRTFLNSMRPGL